MNRWREMAVIASFATLSAWSLPSAGAPRVAVDIDVAPPAPQYEVIPPSREGYVWSPGYWRWDDEHHRHAWVGGEYIHGRHGEHWVPHHWSERNGRWHLDDGHWERG